jgi:hypothetical protein
MQIGEESEAVEVPMPVHPDDIPVEPAAPVPAAPEGEPQRAEPERVPA